MQVQVRIEQQEIDGKKIVRRYEDDVLVAEDHFMNYPTGKSEWKMFNGKGVLDKEKHFYGMMEIMLEISFTSSQHCEMYFVKKKQATRTQYEKARSRYPDMPAANPAIFDFHADNLRCQKQDKRKAAKKQTIIFPNKDAAWEHDEWCGTLIAESDGEDAYSWFVNPKATLGELNRAQSRKLFAKFKNAQCGQIFACDIDRTSSPHENTGDLVVELPEAGENRERVLKIAGKIAEKQGFSATRDNGQRYLYVKLD